MKKWLSYLLVFGLLLTCAGCSKQEPETSDVSSVASQTANASVVEESGVPQKQEEEKQIQSMPVESQPVESIASQPEKQPEEESQEENSEHNEEEPTVQETTLQFSQWDGDYKPLGYYPEVPGKALCRSFKDLQAYLSLFEESFSWEENYTDEYFKTNSLLLSYQDNNVYTIEKITLSESLLSVSWKEKETLFDVTYMEVQPVEIYSSLEDVNEMKMIFCHYIQGSFEKEYTKVYEVK